MKKKLQNRKRVVLRACLVVLLCLVICVVRTTWQIWTFDTTTAHNADAAIVLGASTWNGKPSPVFKERIKHGIELYKSGRVSRLIFSGGTGDGEPISLAEAARDYATQKGVPKEAIIIEPYSRITRENLTYSKQIAEAEGLTSFLIVSDPLHMKRSMRIAHDLKMSAWPSATPTTRYRTMKKRLRFLGRETRFYIQYILLTRFIQPPTLEERMEGTAGTPAPQVPLFNLSHMILRTGPIGLSGWLAVMIALIAGTATIIRHFAIPKCHQHGTYFFQIAHVAFLIFFNNVGVYGMMALGCGHTSFRDRVSGILVSLGAGTLVLLACCFLVTAVLRKLPKPSLWASCAVAAAIASLAIIIIGTSIIITSLF